MTDVTVENLLRRNADLLMELQQAKDDMQTCVLMCNDKDKDYRDSVKRVLKRAIKRTEGVNS